MLFNRATLRGISNLAARRRSSLQLHVKPRLQLLEDRRFLDAGMGSLWISGGGRVMESDAQVEYSIHCAGAIEETVTVSYRAKGESAGTLDFAPTEGALTFAPGTSTWVNIAVPLVDDLLAEDDETFYLELFDAENAVIWSDVPAATIAVNDHAPVLEAIDDQTVDENQQLVFGVAACDIDEPQEALCYSLDAGAPSGATIDPDSGIFSWQTEEIHGPGSFEVTVRVTEAGPLALSATRTITITVNEVNLEPTTTGLADVTVDEDAADTIINLRAAFDDVEDGAAGLVYSVVENSDPNLVGSTSINPATGELRISYVPNAFGWSSITVRATDRGNLAVETTLYVTINPVNDAPVLSSFAVRRVPETQFWIISGHVADVDDDVSGWMPALGGVLSGYNLEAYVDFTGAFSIETELPEISSGSAKAWVLDPGGLQSNIAIAVV